MTPKHQATHDAQVRTAAELHTLADTLHRRALSQSEDAMRHAAAGEWPEADAALAAARSTQVAADALADEAEQL